MSYKVFFDNVDKSSALENFIKSKLEKFSSKVPSKNHLECKISTEADLFSCHLKLSSSNKPYLISSKAKNAYVAVNDVFVRAKSLVSRKAKL